VKTNPPPGRLGSAQVNPPYTNAMGSPYAVCATPSCTQADHPYEADGFKACLGWNNPVTVWRQNTTTPTTETGGTSGSPGSGGAAGTGGAAGKGGSSGTGGTGGSSGTKLPPPPPPSPGGKRIIT